MVLRVALLALLLAALPAAAQTGLAGGDVTLVVYHVHPDPRAGAPDADPFSTSSAPGTHLFEGGSGLRLPVTLVDGVLRADDAPENDPASAFAHYRELQRLAGQRRQVGAPLALTLHADVMDDRVEIHARAEPAGDAVEGQVRFVLAKDPMSDPRGGRAERFVARAESPPHAWDEAGNATATISLPAGLGHEALVLVAIASDSATGEVLQSATWRAGEPPITQTRRSILVEHGTATWCEPCGPRDDAVHLLATQVEGVDQARDDYLRAPSPVALAGLAGGVALGIVLLRRRGP